MARQRGFTLLEMLLVVFILAALAATTSSMIDDAHDQARVDDTRNRLDLIRTAISGTDDVRAPITGFVADMGRTPASVRELLEDLSTPRASYDVDPATGVGSGWRGPYLRTLPGSSGRPELWDGFGNIDEVLLTSDPNFGWVFDAYDVDGDPHPVLGAFPHLQLDAGDVRIASRGGDGALSAKDAENALKIDQAEHHVDVGPWRVLVTLTNPASVSVDVKLALRLWYPDGAGGVSQVTGDANSIDDLAAGETRSVTLEFDTSDPTIEARWIPHGVRAVELVLHDGGSPTPGISDLDERQLLLVDLRARAAPPSRLHGLIRVNDGTP